MKRFQLFSLLIFSFLFSNLFSGEIKDNLGIGFLVNSQRLLGDTRSGIFISGINPVVFRYNFKPFAYFESDIGFTRLSTQISGFDIKTEFMNLGVKAGYRFLHTQRINPLLYLGFGVFNSRVDKSSRNWGGYGAIGVGTELFLNNFIGLNISADFRYTTVDDFDGGNSGSGKDGFINVGIGINYYFGTRTKYMSEEYFTQTSPESEPLVEEVVVDETETNMKNNQKPNSLSNHKLQEEPLNAPAGEKSNTNKTENEVKKADIKSSPVTRMKEFYTVQSGDHLSKIALKYYGHAIKYKEIYEANRDKIEDPNIIHSGQKLNIPFLKKETLNYTVQLNDWLSKIAMLYYGDKRRYNFIFEANRNVLRQSDLIYPGQSLLIPVLTE